MGRFQMATFTISTTGRSTDEPRGSGRLAADTSASGEYRRSAASTADANDEQYEILDYWGSGDPLTCLAAWG
jgi:hypothetical protein